MILMLRDKVLLKGRMMQVRVAVLTHETVTGDGAEGGG